MIYLKITWFLFIIFSIYFIIDYYKKIFNQDTKTLVSFKSFMKGKKTFILSIITFIIISVFSFNLLFLTNRNTRIIIAPDNIIEYEEVEEKTKEELERDSDSKKSNYQKMMDSKYNTDSIRKIEFNK